MQQAANYKYYLSELLLLILKLIVMTLQVALHYENSIQSTIKEIVFTLDLVVEVLNVGVDISLSCAMEEPHLLISIN